MKNTIFITGTDTGAGKTVVTGLLGRFLAEKGINVCTQKWVETGAGGIPPDMKNHLVFLEKGYGRKAEYLPEMSPYVLAFPASPHLAARMEKEKIDVSRIKSALTLLNKKFDAVIIEGTGGLLVPIDDEKTMADVVKRLRVKIIIVVANRLGAINHTLMTVEAARARDLEIAGLIFNRLSQAADERILKDNLKIIERHAGVEVLGELFFDKNTDRLYKRFRPIGKKIMFKLIYA